MAFEEVFSSPEAFATTVGQGMLGGILGSIIVLGLIGILLIFAALYVYVCWAWYTIARKLKHKNPWLAWIPFANVALVLQLGGFHWAWVFLMLIPIFGWIALGVLAIIASWRIFEARHYPGWFSLAPLIPGGVGTILWLVAIGFVAWKDKRK